MNQETDPTSTDGVMEALNQIQSNKTAVVSQKMVQRDSRLLNKEDLQPNLLVQVGSDLFKVSTIGEHRFTATHVYPLQPRTTVRSLSYDTLIHEPSKQIINKYEDAWGYEPGSTR